MPVNPGDIAFVGVNSTDPDQFAILALNAIAAGDSFFVTDGGITVTVVPAGAASSYFRNTEGFLQYTAPSGGIKAGTVILVTVGGGSTPTSVSLNGGGPAGSVSLLPNILGNTTNFSFSTSGDSLTAYRVSSGDHLTGTPVLLAFIGFGGFPYGSGSAQNSNIPAITNGQVLNIGNLDNAIFTNAVNVYAQSITALSSATSFTARDSLRVDLTTLSSAPVAPTVSLSLSSTNGSEAGQSVITVNATASSPVIGNQTVALAVSGSGITGEDYILDTSTVTIASGSTSGSVTFTVVDDALVEGTETATLTISNPSSGITLGSPTSQIITITDNDSPPTVNLSLSAVTGSEATQSLITLTATSSAPVLDRQTLEVVVSGSSITPSDYSLSSVLIEIAAGQTSGSVTFSIVDDALFEGSETATFTLNNPSSGLSLGPVISQTITIVDNEVLITEINATGNSSAYGADWFEITNTSSSDIGISGWRIDDNSNSFANSVPLRGLTFVPAGRSAIFLESDVNGANDSAVIAAFSKAWFDGPTLPVSSLLFGFYGGNAVGFSASGDAVNVFDASGGLVTRVDFGPATASASFDNVSGISPVYMLSMPGLNGASVSFNGLEIGSPGTITNTPLPRVSILSTDESATEAGLNTATFRIARTGAINSALTVGYLVSTGSGEAGVDDYSPILTGNAVIAAGQSFVDIIITPVDDLLVEGTEGLGLVLVDSPSYTIGNSTAAITIGDNDFATAAPTLNEISTTTFFNLPATVGGALSGVINDPTDPARTLGIDFTIADADTDIQSLILTVNSSNGSVVSNSNLNLSGTGSTRNLKVVPTGVGFTDITLSVSDGTNTSSYVINYAASASSANPGTTRFFTGTSDASSAVAIDNQFMLVADDEDQVLRLYDRNHSGLPITEFDFTSSLALTDTSAGLPREVDIEASLQVGNRIYWLGSLSNSSGGANRPNRNRLFATDLVGSGVNASLAYVGHYDNLKSDLIGWGDSYGYNFSASSATGVIPEVADGSGLNVEGLTLAPDGTTAYVAFRAPLVPTSSRGMALLAPITNFAELVMGTATIATIGTPIELDLGGRGIREIKRSSGGDYLIIAGPAGTATGTPPKDFRLYTWSGNAVDAPVLRSADLTSLLVDGSIESIVDLPANIASSSLIQLLVDNGDTDFYTNSVAAKDLVQSNFKKFRSELVTLGVPLYPLPAGALSLRSPYIQNFNALISDGTSTWLNSSTLSGWLTARSGNGSLIVANNGNSNAGNLYSYGLTSNSDRALGSVGSGNASAGGFFWGARFFNDTDRTISTLYVSYVGEQWRNSGSTAQTIDFQYKLQATSLTTGSWTDVNSLDFTSPAWGGTSAALDGNLASNRRFLSGAIEGLSLSPGQEIWLRWSDPDHSGSDHGLAIDDLQVSINPLPGVVISETSGGTAVNEAGATTDSYTVALTTVPTAPVVISIVAADAQTVLSHDGNPFTDSITLILTDINPKTVTVKAVDDSAVEVSPHVGVIAHTSTSDDSHYNHLAIANITASIVDDDAAPLITLISQIQGAGTAYDPAYGGIRTIEGVVTRTFKGATQLNGFYVQEEDADSDGSNATSEAIFVYDPVGLFAGNQGDKVRITGTVAEYTSSATGISGIRNSSLTQLANVTNIVNLGEVTLPTITSVSLPVIDSVYLERFEGMLVNISSAGQPLVVTETYKLGRYGQVGLSVATRLGQYTQFNLPSVSGYSDFLSNINDGYIILDDGRSVQNPDPVIFARNAQPLSASNPLRGGDSIASITGILDERFEGYRVQSGSPVNFVDSNPRTSTAPFVTGTLKIASFNLLNYFNGNGSGVTGSSGGFPTSRGADSLLEYDRQRFKTISAILGLDADIIAYNELENDGYGPFGSAQQLVDGINAALGVSLYSFITPPPSLLQPDGRFGGDEISVGFIYRVDRVRQAPGSSVVALQSGSFDQGAGRIQRPALAVSFERLNAGAATGEQMTAVVTHLKSKGSSAGGIGDEDSGDGQGLSNGSRTRAAIELADWLDSSPTGLNDPDVLILGDLNSYLREDPITALSARGYQSIYGPDSYSYQFSGQWGSLDHMLASASLASQLGGSIKWHINSDEPVTLDYNTEFKSTAQVTTFYSPDPFRSSDHDPLLAGFVLTSSKNPPNSIVLSASTVNENVSPGTVVANLSTVDPDVGNTFHYSLVSGSGSIDNLCFSILGDQLLLLASPDFETRSSYAVRLRTTDQDGLFYEQSFGITINDLNEAPTAVTLTNSVSGLLENSSTISRVHLADISISDDAFGHNSVSISGDDAAFFEVYGTGLYLKAGVVLDYEITPNYTIVLEVTDTTVAGSSSATTTYGLVVSNINEAPAASNASLSLAEDTPTILSASHFGAFADGDGDSLAGVVITTLPTSGTLEFLNDSYWQAVVPAQSLSAADLAAGKLRFSPAANATGNPYSSLGFQVSDGTILSASSYNLSFIVTPVNDGPAGFVINGSAAVGQTLVAIQQFGDPDGNGSGDFTYSWQSSADGTIWLPVGTNSSSYNVVAADYGRQLRLQVSYNDGQDNAEVLTIAAGVVSSADSSPPMVEQIWACPQQIGLRFSEPVLVTGTGIQSPSFTVQVNGVVRTISSASLDGSLLLLNLAGDILDRAASLSLAYSDPGSGASGAITDLAGNRSASFLPQPISHYITPSSNNNLGLGLAYTALTLSGSAAIDGTGNALANTITGNNAANILDGRGGADTLIGGLGDDTYLVDTALDQVIELADGGIDTVRSSISWTLAEQLENLVLLGNDAINGTGNALNNTITGNGRANSLDGGAGADTLSGGLGDDTYLVDDPGDQVIEQAAAGTDTVRSSMSWTLAEQLENLVLLGSGAINGTGNALNNTITGNAGDNLLDGAAGRDRLIGGDGNDTYVVDQITDTVVEQFDQGSDTVISSVSWVIGANVENLTLSGSSPLSAIGNNLDNQIVGNSGANIIDGGAGGRDVLTGGGGADQFRFSSLPQLFGYADADQITDFSAAEGDRLRIHRSVFSITTTTATLASVESSAQLTGALQTNALFIYDRSSGELHWNQNGLAPGAGSGGVLAVLTNRSTLTSSQIALV